MNLYLRFFDDETLVHSVDEGLAFLATLDDVEVTNEMAAELQKFMQSSAMFPKHIKVKARNFFIAIKTTAATMEEFKAKGAGQNKEEKGKALDLQAVYGKHQPGWYAAKMTFKRIIVLPDTLKAQPIDTPFACKLKAESPQDCYDKVINYLRERQDVDPRSQFPSIKNANFEYRFLGDTEPGEATPLKG